MAEKKGKRVAAPDSSGASAVKPICSLPIVGNTTVEDAVFYGAAGLVAITGLVSWPTAALIGTGHALHQRSRNVVRTGTFGEAREGVVEAVEDVI
jgi:hypothetical protein